ncbi:MAG: uroporphyrinogen decarboxylase family protein [Candidatus Firestonebacteria bacterium]
MCKSRVVPNFERLRKVLLLQGEPDRIPIVELGVDDSVKKAFLGRVSLTAKDNVDFWHEAGYDYINLWLNYGLRHDSSVEKIADIDNDSKDRVWAPEGKGAITTWEEFEKFPWPDKKISYQNFEETNLYLPDGMKIIAGEGNIFTHTWEMMGFEYFSFALVENPDLVEAIFNKIGEIIYSAFKGVMSCPNLGALWFTDDIAYTEGLMVSPKVLRKYLFPWIKKIGDLAKENNLPYIYHTDGRLWEVLDDLIDCGINAIHPMEPKAWNAVEVKKKYGNKLCLIGNIDLDRICRGTTVEIEEMVKERIKNLAKGGGYCLGSSNTIPNYVSIENYKAMLEASFKYGKYPI